MATNYKNKIYDNNDIEPSEVDPLRQEVTSKRENKKSSVRDKLCNVIKNVTVEPCILLFIIIVNFNMMASQNFQLEKACRVNLNFSTEICDSLALQDGAAESQYEKEVQQLVANTLAWRTYLTSTIPCILALFVGSFSDRTGHRKLFILIPITGQAAVAINNILYQYFFYEINLQTMVLIDSSIDGLTGGLCFCFLTAFAYISTITTEKDRTYRMGILTFCITLALPIGMGLSGVLLKAIGFYGVFGVTASVHLINALYVIFVLKDPKRTPEQKQHDRQGCCYLVRIFFDISNIKKTVEVIFRETTNKRRLRLCVLLSVLTVLFGPMVGEISIFYLSVRYRFKWDEIQYSLFQSYSLVINFIGTTFSVLLFAKYLKWHDSVLIIISSLSKIGASLVYGFAQTGALFYLGPVVDILNGTSLLAMRSMLSKMVEEHEIGKLSSVNGVVENLMPLIYVPMYTKIYTATMEVLPGAVFLVSASLTVPAVFVLSYFFYEHRKQLRSSKSNPVAVE